MGSPFKMNPKTPFMKALVGKQGNLPQHLQDAIKAAPAKSTKKPSVEDDVVIDTKTREEKRKRGGMDIITTETSERGGKGLGTTMGDRQGVGRIQTKTYRKMKGTGKKGSKGATESTKISGADGMRRLADGTKVVKEATVSAIKPRGVDTGKKKSKGKSPAKSYGKSPVKSTGGKKKLGTEGMSYKEKVAYYEKQKKAKPAKNPKIRMGMGTSYKTVKK
jgi:hypothetical protein